jgi:hypothetical protein
MKKAAILGFLIATCLWLLVLAVQGRHPKDHAFGPNTEGTGEGDLPSPIPSKSQQPTHQAPVAVPRQIRQEEKKTVPAGGMGLTHEDIARGYENAYRSDQPPNASSAKREAAIVAAFGSPRAEGAHLNGVDCRATRCRIDVDFTSQEADKRVLLAFVDLLSSSGIENVSDLGFFVSSRDELPDGKIKADIHLFPVERTPKP